MRQIPGRKVHNTLFGLEEEPVNEDQQDTRGRDPELIRQRDEHLLYRYNYYRSKYYKSKNDPRLDYDWIMEQLGREFYLTPYTVGKKIADNIGLSVRIHREKISIAKLQEKYPFFKW